MVAISASLVIHFRQMYGILLDWHGACLNLFEPQTKEAKVRKNSSSHSKMTESYKHYSGKESSGRHFKRLAHRNERHQTKRSLSQILWAGEMA
ncbi:MAG: hypothetical protein ACFCUX_01550 [Candidatus Methylacidiphilales bacterium]